MPLQICMPILNFLKFLPFPSKCYCSHRLLPQKSDRRNFSKKPTSWQHPWWSTWGTTTPRSCQFHTFTCSLSYLVHLRCHRRGVDTAKCVHSPHCPRELFGPGISKTEIFRSKYTVTITCSRRFWSPKRRFSLYALQGGASRCDGRKRRFSNTMTSRPGSRSPLLHTRSTY